MDKEILEFGKFSIELLAKHLEKYLGPLPNYKMELRPRQKYDRPDVSINVEGLGLFVFFEEGISQRLLLPLRENNNRIYAVGSWIETLIHELVHLYQEIPFQKIYKNNKERHIYFRQYNYWADGLAEHLALKISLELYKKSKAEGNYWEKRESPKDVMEALKLQQYKLGIRRRVICVATTCYFVLLNKGLERHFTLPEFVPDDIKREISLAIKQKKCSFEYPKYFEEIFNRILKGEEKITNLLFHYAIGFVCVDKIIEEKENYLGLLNNPKDNQQLLKLAQIQIE